MRQLRQEQGPAASTQPMHGDLDRTFRHLQGRRDVAVRRGVGRATQERLELGKEGRLPSVGVLPTKLVDQAGARWRRDLAVVNGRVVTLEDDQPAAEAVLVRQGRVALVGTTDLVTREAGSAPRFDAAGRTVVPGFVDPHVHFEMACNALSYQVACHTPPLTSLREIKDALRAKAAGTPPGEWIIGRGSFGMAGRVEEGHLPERAELDVVTEDHPLILYSGFHVAMMNTRGLKELGLWDDDTKVPRGAILHRDASGAPTGVATEVWPMPPAYSVDQVKASLRAHARDLYVSKGITSISTLPLAGTDLVADQALQASGDLPIRLRAYYHVPHLLTLEDFLGMGPGQGFGTDMFRVGGVKIFVDGAGGDGLDRRFADFKWRRKSSTRSSCGPTATASS